MAQTQALEGLGSASPISLRGADAGRFRQIMQYAVGRSLNQRPLGEIVQAIAHQLLGSTYRPNLLERSRQEDLVVSLTQFDCVLFVETVLALAKGVAVQDYSDLSFMARLQNQRYREGRLNGYCSRLHYFSEWISDNQQRGNVLNLTAQLGGSSLRKP
ncbi:MAG: N-acetylmuramoyl-L-alanine amidase-like domain-containing protein, partial [Kovacikia sp.]